MLRHICLVALIWTVFTGGAFAADKPVLQAGTETATPGEIRPSPELVRVVLGAIDQDDVQQLDTCLSEQGLRRLDYASLLRAVRVDAGAGVSLWFVRPAEEPFCQALYGAHLFRYFWIREQSSGLQRGYRLLFRNGGDSFVVYTRQSHGLNDIEATGCIADRCRSTRMAYDGHDYRPVRCSWMTWDKQHHQAIHPRRCGPEDGRDEQASGLASDK